MKLYSATWTMINMFRPVYVFDPREASGWDHRVPQFVARFLCRPGRAWHGMGYWYTPEGM